MATLTVGIHEAKVHFSEYAHHVELGDSVIVTRHGRPALRMVPIEAQPQDDLKMRAAAFARWEEARKDMADVRFDIKAAINEGRL